MSDGLSPKKEKPKKTGSGILACLSAPCGLPRQPGIARATSSGKTTSSPETSPKDFTSKHPHIQEVNKYVAAPRTRSNTFSAATKPLVQVNVRFATGANVDVPLHVSTQESMVALKLRLQNMQNVRAETIRLLWRGKELQDAETVESTGLAKDGGTIQLLTWPPSRAPTLDAKLVEEAMQMIQTVGKADIAPLLNVAGEDTPDNYTSRDTEAIDFGIIAPVTSTPTNKTEGNSRSAWRYLSFLRGKNSSQRLYE
mmetsp:Transcript_20220/g.36668  ORF Transcript_20220/g.36668 Transcript_20220/m.36668 type:complete len:254 (+) Transcript_20220:127-888(+)